MRWIEIATSRQQIKTKQSKTWTTQNKYLQKGIVGSSWEARSHPKDWAAQQPVEGGNKKQESSCVLMAVCADVKGDVLGKSEDNKKQTKHIKSLSVHIFVDMK